MPLITLKDWLSIQIQLDETTEFVRKQQLMMQWLNELGLELNTLPAAIEGLIDAEKQAALEVLAGLVAEARVYKEVAETTGGEVASALGEFKAGLEAVELLVQQAQAAAAGDVIDDAQVSELRVWSSQETLRQIGMATDSKTNLAQLQAAALYF